MKLSKFLAAAILAAFAAAPQAAQARALVLYFSMLGPDFPADAHPSQKMGRTQYVAYAIKDAVDGDIFRVQTARPYSYKTYDELLAIAKSEHQRNARPEMKGELPDLSGYDTVYVGSALWWSDYPMVFYTMLDASDFRGKILVPFNTNGGTGAGMMESTLRKAEPNAKAVLPCLTVRDSDAKRSDGAVRTWLTSHGLLK
jgi:flavodoxin